MEKIIKKFYDLQQDTIYFEKKENNNVEATLASIGCDFFPKQLVEFYSSYKFARFSADDILSLEEIENELENFADFLDAMGIDNTEDRYVPFGVDGMGGYYAFISNKKDESIYWLDHENPDELNKFEDFKSFLEDRYECEVYIMEEDE